MSDVKQEAQVCDATTIRENENRLRHCTRPPGHDAQNPPIPGQRQHSDGDKEWW